MKYNLASSTWDEKEIEAIQRVIESNQYSMGKFVNEFEHNFSSFFGSKYSVMVNSGSSANLLGVASLFFKKQNPLKKGDVVIVPAVSWSTTYAPLQQLGLKVRFVDIDINTLNYNLYDLKSALCEKTKLIIAVNLLGNPNDFDEINKIISNKNIYLFEDNCESMGAMYNNCYTGTIGILGTFSTFFSHHISTMEGGVITTNNEELYHILLSLRAHGWTRNLPINNSICKKGDDPFKESFRFILPGYNVRPLEMSGAIGIEQLKKLPKFIEERRLNAKIFIDLFGSDDRFIIQKEISKSSWFGFSFIINPNIKSLIRKNILNHLAENNIETRPIVSGNFTQNEVLKYFDYDIYGDLPNAELLDKSGFFIGNHHYSLEKELRSLKRILK